MLQRGKTCSYLKCWEKEKESRFLGAFLCDSWEHRQAPDRDGTMRSAIVFHLIPVAEGDAPVEEADGAEPNVLGELRKRAIEMAAETPERRSSEAQTNIFRAQCNYQDICGCTSSREPRMLR